MEKFVDFITSYVKPDKDELAAIVKVCQKKSYKKDAYLLRKGQVAQHFVYLKKGSVRFYKKEKNRETTIWVAFEDNLAFEMTSYFVQKPTELYVKALEDVEVYIIRKEEVEKMLKYYAYLARVLSETLGRNHCIHD